MMKPLITNNIDVDKIKLLPVKRYEQNHYVWPIEYEKQSMCFQTSYLQLARYNKNYNNMSLSTYFKPVQSSKKKFVKIIRDIDNKIVYILSKLKKKIKYRKKLEYRKSYILQNKYIYYNFPLQKSNNNIVCNIYDDKKNLQSLDYIEPGCDIYSILWLKNIWLKGDKAGLNYIIVQLKVYKPIIYIHNCLIIEDKDIFDNNNTKSNNTTDTTNTSIQPDYLVYLKMKKMGVPLKAIQMKMKLAGHDPNIILSINDKTKKNNIINTTNKSKLKSRLSPMDLLNGIQNKKLKKVKKKKISEKQKKMRVLQRLGVLSKRNGIPTLEEIIQTRNRLKKIR